MLRVHRARNWDRMLAMTLLLAIVGCSGGQQPVTGLVTGTVTFNGNPVGAGSVNFLSAKGVGAQAELDDGGTFQIPNPLEVGEYKVYLTPPLPEPRPPGAAPETTPKFEVPSKFQDASSSGIKITIEQGPNDIPVEING